MINKMGNMKVRLWLAIAGVATFLIGGSYAMVQQSTRLSANDLPETTAQLARQELDNKSMPSDVVPQLRTDIRRDNSVFVIITDSTKHVLASSASLDSQTPLPPNGVFSFTAKHGNDHFTWQPSGGVRAATYVLAYGSNGGGYIVAGQNLKPFEDRVKIYTMLAAAAWIACLAWSYLLLLLPADSRK